MGVIVNKNNQEDELSRRINADLREKMSEISKVEGNNDPDFAEESEYVKDLKKTGKFSWIIIVLIILAAVVSFLAFGPFQF